MHSLGHTQLQSAPLHIQKRKWVTAGGSPAIAAKKSLNWGGAFDWWVTSLRQQGTRKGWNPFTHSHTEKSIQKLGTRDLDHFLRDITQRRSLVAAG